MDSPGLLPLLAASILAVACAGPSASDAPSAATIQLRDWSIKLSPDLIKSGSVRFDVRNPSRLAHEIVLIQTDTPAEALTVIGGEVDEASAGRIAARIADVRPGTSRSQFLDLEAGKYLLICNLLGHYQLGMRAELEVR